MRARRLPAHVAPGAEAGHEALEVPALLLEGQHRRRQPLVARVERERVRRVPAQGAGNCAERRAERTFKADATAGRLRAPGG